MKLPEAHAVPPRPERAFTLVEALIASVTLVIVVASAIMCNLFGLSMAMRQQIWLSASDDAAKAISTIMVDVRSCTSLQVGSYSGNAFTQAGGTNQQSGNALLVYSTTNALPWVLYYYDTVSNNLVRSNFYGIGSNNDVRLVSANPITNDLTHPIFTEVDYNGTPLSNTIPVACVSIYLSFTKLQDPQVVIENGAAVDLYQIVTTVTPRIKL